MTTSTRITTHTVLSSGLHDADIRPPELLDEFRRLSIRDASRFFADPADQVAVDCPACGQPDGRAEFAKEGFSYLRCPDCDSLYVSPRPTAEALARYGAESEAMRFRAARFAEATAVPRRQHQLRAHAGWMAQLAETRGLPRDAACADFRTYLPEFFDELAATGAFGPLYAIEPQGDLARTTANAQPRTLEDLPPVDALSAFEKLEHQYSPRSFLERLAARLRPGGLLFFTTRASTGFDLRLLGGRAPYIFVPEHLNLLSIRGLEGLLQDCGLELIELSTPGQLDVELVLRACAADPSIALPPFFQELLARRDRHAHADFQAFLQKHRLSSHVRVAARRVP